jgi:hypothetical protein
MSTKKENEIIADEMIEFNVAEWKMQKIEQNKKRFESMRDKPIEPQQQVEFNGDDFNAIMAHKN